jgi:hypothetical protein
MITSDGPALVQLSMDELLLPGDEVLLMLVKVEDMMLTTPGTGIVFFEDGIARPEAASLIRDQIAGLPRAAVIAQVKAAFGR